jgi:hypothetical protein
MPSANRVWSISFTLHVANRFMRVAQEWGALYKSSTDLLYFDRYQWDVFCEQYRMLIQRNS